jgi:N-acetylglutamate synthase
MISDQETIRETEEHLMNAWPSLRTVMCNGWAFRQANGYTKRANSANALAARGDFAATLASARSFYGSSPTIFRLTPLAGPEPDAVLSALGFEHVDETLVMTAAIADREILPATAGVAVETSCPEEWENGYAAAYDLTAEQRRGHRAILGRIAPLPTAFATLYDDGRAIAFGLGVVERGRLGLFDIVTSPGYRRHGAARQIVSTLLGWGRAQAAHTAWLSVIHANANALPLYEQFGFRESYRYHYRVSQ